MVRPLLGDEPLDQRVQIMMTAGEVEAVERWRFENRVASRSEAIRDLIRRGLAAPDDAGELPPEARSRIPAQREQVPPRAAPARPPNEPEQDVQPSLAAASLFARALLAYKAEGASRAVTLYEQALALDPGHVDARYNLACIFARTGQLDEALQHLRALAGVDSDEARKALAEALDDDDFAKLRTNEEFLAMMAPAHE